MSETYYRPHDLSRFSEMGKERPELWAKFLDYYNAVFADGALTVREKALIALGVAHAVQCPYCIDAYTQASLQNGADREQLTEAVLNHDGHVQVGPPLFEEAQRRGEKNNVADRSQPDKQNARAGGKRRKKRAGGGWAHRHDSASIFA